MSKTPSKPDVLEFVRNAKSSEIRNRLAELEGERQALRTLLRSVEAKERTAASVRKGGGP
jgi:hypothetical protein